MAVALTVLAAALGFACFALAERLDFANAKKPYATGRERHLTFYDDAKVGMLRLAGAAIPVLALLAWVIGRHVGR